ncbi:MAG: 6-phosphogluconolactonase [Actinomycetota bacterium]|nr:6-phosphogluconolactonase [Actinomycetota bacterium]
MTFRIEVFDTATYATEAAGVIASHLPPSGSVVLTGGTTAEKIYPELASVPADWSQLAIAFSDERCVPPHDEASNFRMASVLLLDVVQPKEVHRMPGEDDPEEGAEVYHQSIAPLVAAHFDLLLLGMGADAHIGAMFPHSPALSEHQQFCRAVDRPDGMKGLTLTPPAMTTAKRILLLVTGEAKAATVQRAVQGGEPPDTCPVRLLADHPDTTFLLDRSAAAAL